MADIKEASDTAEAGQKAGIQTVGDAFEALDASKRKAIIGEWFEPEKKVEPEKKDEPDASATGEDSTSTSDLSQSEDDDEPKVKPEEGEEQAAEEEGEEQAAEEEADDSDQEEEHKWDDPKWVERWKGKHVRRVKELEEQLQAAEARAVAAEAKPDKLDALPQEIVQGDPEVKKHAESLAKLESGLANVQEMLRRVAHEPEAVAAALKQANVPVYGEDADSLRSQLEDLREAFRDQRTDRRQDLQMSQMAVVARQRQRLADSRKQAEADFEWLNDQKSPGWKLAMDLLKDAPWIKAMPDPWKTLATYVEGELAIKGRKQAQSQKKVKPVKALKIPSPKAAPAPSRVERNVPSISSDEREKALMGGDRRLRLKMIQNMLSEK